MTEVVNTSGSTGNDSFGMLAEFKDVDAILHAAETVRDAGFTKWESYTPFPVHGLDDAMGAKPTRLPWITFICGATGTCAGLFLELYTSSTGHGWVPESMQDTVVGKAVMAITPYIPTFLQGYPTQISGKPFMSIPAYIPIAFETTILLAAISTVVGLFALCKLPRLYHPLFKKKQFKRATSDRFFIAIESDDPKYNREEVKALFEKLHALSIEAVEE